MPLLRVMLIYTPRLPFIDDNDCGLGIAVRTYLDDLPLQANPTSPEARSEVKAKGKEWFQHSESFTGNLDLAFKLWDAVSDIPLLRPTPANSSFLTTGLQGHADCRQGGQGYEAVGQRKQVVDGAAVIGGPMDFGLLRISQSGKEQCDGGFTACITI